MALHFLFCAAPVRLCRWFAKDRYAFQILLVYWIYLLGLQPMEILPVAVYQLFILFLEEIVQIGFRPFTIKLIGNVILIGKTTIIFENDI